MERLIDFAISLLAGVMGIVLVLWVERQRRPRVCLRKGSEHEIGTSHDPRPHWKWLRIQVQMVPIPRWLRWAYQHRDPALSCQAWIAFHHYPDGGAVFGDIMEGRWSEAPPPEVVPIAAHGRLVGKGLGARNARYDIHPTDQPHIDVVIKLEGEDRCYGWTAESYVQDWKHPRWSLGPGRYITLVKLRTAWEEVREAFLLSNDTGMTDFRLEDLPPDDRIRLGSKLGLVANR